MTAAWESLRHYGRVYACIVRMSLRESARFRANFLVSLGAHLAIDGVHLLVAAVLFSQTDRLEGWTPAHYLLFLGTFHIADGLEMVFCFFNSLKLPEYIRKGELEVFLVRPLNAQWLVLFYRFNVESIFDILYGAGLALWALGRLAVTPTAGEVAMYVLLTLNGALLLGSLNCISQILAFWLGQGRASMLILEGTLEFGFKPDVVLPRWLWALFTFVLPITVMFSFPTRAAGGLLSPGLTAWALVAGAGTVLLQNWLWNKGVARYSSAGG